MNTEKTKTTLDKKTIAAIAAQVETRMRQDDSPRASVDRTQPKKEHGSKGVFFWGAASGLALAIAAPLLGKQARPAVRGAIKGGIVAGRYVQRVASSVKEDVQDLSAEAAADLETGNPEPDSSAGTKRKGK